MLTAIIPKLPMLDKSTTKDFYVTQLGFHELGDYEGYLMVMLDNIEIYFFEFKSLDLKENYGKVYIRTDNIDQLYELILSKGIAVHPNEHYL
jgi:hypothetical protein